MNENIEHIKRLSTSLTELVEAIESAEGTYNLRDGAILIGTLDEARQVLREHTDWLLDSRGEAA